MTPYDYCQQKACPRGSAFYYSSRKLTKDQRLAVTAIMAFYQEIEDITVTYDDFGVAHAKLNWWRDEIIKIQDGKPTHPVAIGLQDSLKKFSLSPLPLIEIIEGLEQNLTLPSFEKFEDVVIHFMRTAGKREWMIASVLLEQDESLNPEAIYQVALVIELTQYLQNLRRYVRRGLIYFSQDDLQRFKVSEAQLREFKTTKNIVELLQFQVEKITRAYQKAQELLTSKQREQLLNIIVRCEIARAILHAIQTSHYSVLENFINITPLRCWWIAYIAH
ncbi:MAG: squalene/phytoene synthase family protein [Gammaproteobacteria bacterium]